MEHVGIYLTLLPTFPQVSKPHVCFPRIPWVHCWGYTQLSLDINKKTAANLKLTISKCFDVSLTIDMSKGLKYIRKMTLYIITCKFIESISTTKKSSKQNTKNKVCNVTLTWNKSHPCKNPQKKHPLLLFWHHKPRRFPRILRGLKSGAQQLPPVFISRWCL